MDKLIKDPYFRVEVINKTERPNLVVYSALRQDYSESNVFDKLENFAQLSEAELGEKIVRLCVNKKHFGVLEYPSITLNCIGFPHKTMVQARTHRVATTFDVQSMRYSGKRLFDLGKQLFDLDCTFEPNDTFEETKIQLEKELLRLYYLRPTGKYVDRKGKHYQYSEDLITDDIYSLWEATQRYYQRISSFGYSYEHARDFLPQTIRQDFVVGFNARSLLHFIDVRLKADVEDEAYTLASMIFAQFQLWMPEVAEWYSKNRLNKNKLAP